MKSDDIDGLQFAIHETCEGSPKASLQLQIEHVNDFALYATPPMQRVAQPIVAIEIWDGVLQVIIYHHDSEEPLIIPVRLPDGQLDPQ